MNQALCAWLLYSTRNEQPRSIDHSFGKFVRSVPNESATNQSHQAFVYRDRYPRPGKIRPPPYAILDPGEPPRGITFRKEYFPEDKSNPIHFISYYDTGASGISTDSEKDLIGWVCILNDSISLDWRGMRNLDGEHEAFVAFLTQRFSLTVQDEGSTLEQRQLAARWIMSIQGWMAQWKDKAGEWYPNDLEIAQRTNTWKLAVEGGYDLNL